MSTRHKQTVFFFSVMIMVVLVSWARGGEPVKPSQESATPTTSPAALPGKVLLVDKDEIVLKMQPGEGPGRYYFADGGGYMSEIPGGLGINFRNGDMYIPEGWGRDYVHQFNREGKFLALHKLGARIGTAMDSQIGPGGEIFLLIDWGMETSGLLIIRYDPKDKSTLFIGRQGGWTATFEELNESPNKDSFRHRWEKNVIKSERQGGMYPQDRIYLLGDELWLIPESLIFETFKAPPHSMVSVFDARTGRVLEHSPRKLSQFPAALVNYYTQLHRKCGIIHSQIPGYAEYRPVLGADGSVYSMDVDDKKLEVHRYSFIEPATATQTRPAGDGK